MNSNNRYLIGMDLGTTNIKAMLMDESGNLIASASRPNGKVFPGPGMVEQDANEWWSNAVSIFKEISEAAGLEVIQNIKGISISSQCVTLLPVDAQGIPVHNAIIYQDGRSLAEVNEISDTIGADKFIQIVGGQPSPSFLPGKLLWFKRNLPEEFAKTHTILQANSYLNYKLTGQFTMDVDTASRSQCMNLNTLTWSPEIGEVLGIDLNNLMPPVKQCTEIIGTVTADAAKLTGLVEGIPVVAGCSDAMASVYATGMSKSGDAGESCGTSSLVFASAMEASLPTVPIVTRPTGLVDMPFVYDGPIGSTGASVKWYLETISGLDMNGTDENGKTAYDIMNEIAAQAAPGCNGVIYYPYLIGGERAPLWNTHARGMFIGLSQNTDKAQIARSIYEGTAFALRHVMDEITKSGGKIEHLRVTGGGAKSNTWNQIKASMLHVPVYVMDDRSGDVPFGDVLLAGYATGIFPDLSAAMQALVKVKDIVEPNPEWEKMYDAMYPFFVQMYAHLDQDLAEYKNLF